MYDSLTTSVLVMILIALGAYIGGESKTWHAKWTGYVALLAGVMYAVFGLIYSFAGVK